MRILYHHRTQADDAQGIHIYEMINVFQQLGHVVDLVALVELDEKRDRKIRGKRWEKVAAWVPNPIYELMELAYNLVGYHRLFRRIRQNRPDLIYERYSLNTFCGIWASRRFGIPIILEVNAPLYYEQRKLGKLTFKSLARFSEQWVCSNSTKTLTVSNVMKGMLEGEGVPPEKLIVMPNAINPTEFHPGVSGSEVIRRYRLEGKMVIGFVGWFRNWHGLESLLEVFYEARMNEAGGCLMLIGDGPAASNLQRFVNEKGIEESVIFTGPVERKEMPAHIAALDIALQPSVTEYASPMKIFEYMGMGKCIVAPDQPNIREILKDRQTAFLFKPGDKEQLKSILVELVANGEKRRSAGQKAYQSIFDRGFLWKTNAQKALNLVSGIDTL